MTHYRLLVIGGGTGGLRTALAAAKMGHTVCLVEPGVLGGTCLNTGCIPTKAMLHASLLYRGMKGLRKYGIIPGTVKLDMKRMMRHVHSFIEDGEEHIAKGMKHYPNLTLVKDRATFVNESTVLAGGREISADNIIISTGASNVRPQVEGLTEFLDNESVINLEKLPKSIAMIGGGYISMEFATFFSDMGCKVHVIEKFPKILGMLDDDIVDLLTSIYEGRGVSLRTSTNIVHVKKKKGGYRILLNESSRPYHSKYLDVEQVLVAIGRHPNTHDLGLEKAGVQVGDRHGITINDRMQTTNPRVYAIGDVTGRAMFAHAVKRESRIILDNIFSGKDERMNFDLVPWAVFTDPAVAGVGIGEKAAIDKKIDYGVLKAPFSKDGRAAIMGNTEGFVKVLYDRQSRAILGATIIGPDADDLIHEISVIMYAGAKVDVIHEAVHIHPTLAEVMEELREEKDEHPEARKE